MNEPETDAGRSSGEIGAAANALRLLRMFETGEDIRVGAASEQLQVSRSTVHRLLTTLAAHGFVEQNPASRSYRPGPSLTAIGRAVVQTGNQIGMNAALVELAQLTNETVHLAVLRGESVFYLNSIESEQSVRTRSRVGWTLPSHTTAAGKSLLAALTDEDVLNIFPSAIIAGATARRSTTQADLLAELEMVRARGYATNDGESEPDVSAVAAVLRDGTGRAQAALAVTAPRSRVDDVWMREVGEITVSVAGRYNASIH